MFNPEEIIFCPTAECNLRCPHCFVKQNKITLDQKKSIDFLVSSASNIKKIGFSGGEPFCQAEALSELARKCHENGLNVMSYTGYTFEQLVAGFDEHPDWKALLYECDYLVDGPFILEERSLMLLFRGSKNQRFLDVKKSLAQGKAVSVDEKTLYDK